MKMKQVKRNVVLGILFFLPVTFLLFLYPAKHNYTPLDIVGGQVEELHGFTSDSEEEINLQGHITVLAFFGNKPEDHFIAASNLKELVYDKFKGFKRFQIIVVMPEGYQEAAKTLEAEINAYDDLRFWHFVFGTQNNIKGLFNSLKYKTPLDGKLSTSEIFIVDKELNQRGRIDDRTDNEVEKHKPVFGLPSYNSIEVAEIKNKMSEDIRILFTEYRQKRKGDFNSSIRRDNELKAVDNNG